MMLIGIVGVGPVGRTLGTAWARAGHEVAFGSRDLARAGEVAMGLAGARAVTQEEAAAFGEVVLWTPRGVMPDDPDILAGKIVLDPNNRGAGPADNYASPRPQGPSLAERLQAAAPRARVVKAFNTVVMRLLSENPERLRMSGAQVLLAGDDATAKTVAATLAGDIGLGVVDLGGLEAAWLAETMADAFRQAMRTSPAGWRQALVFADLTGRQRTGAR
jgi:predicted dinucleotide-binding enzyme